jgi:hypothetical protein
MDMTVSLRLDRRVDDGEPNTASRDKTDHGVDYSSLCDHENVTWRNALTIGGWE